MEYNFRIENGMEDFEVYDEPTLRESKKTELPAVEMQVTQLVECDPPILSATASGTE